MGDDVNKIIIDLIYKSVTSEGGDGDAYWLSKYTKLTDLIALIDEYKEENNIDWELIIHDDYILWGTGQEWATITDSKGVFDERPDWIILNIDY